VDTPVNNVDWLPTFLELAALDIPSDLDGVSLAQGLKGGQFPVRPMFWHYPHYTNQGGRPSGVMREGNWMLLQFYDEDKTELYNLANDVGQQHDLAKHEPERATAMKSALEQWLTSNNARRNTPNPDFSEEEFRKVYVDVDASRFDPLSADEAGWARMREWRKNMNRLVPWKPSR
jgi:arylsulfatase A-like enzyme